MKMAIVAVLLLPFAYPYSTISWNLYALSYRRPFGCVARVTSRLATSCTHMTEWLSLWVTWQPGRLD